MGWTAITAGMSWQAAALYNEIVAAVAERAAARGVSLGVAPSTKAAGDYAQGKSLWEHAQVAAETLAPLFVQSHDLDGTPRAGDAFDGQGDFALWTFENAAKAAGRWTASGHGWRRVTGAALPADWTDIDDAAYSWGRAQVGDIMGPWVLSDIRALLAVLIWTLHINADPGGDDWDTDADNFVYVDASGAALAAVKTAAEAAFAAYAPINVNDYWPMRWSLLDASQAPGTYSAALQSVANRQRMAGVPNTQARAVEWYAKGSLPNLGGTLTFDALGSGLLEDQWLRWAQTAATTDAVLRSAESLGSLARATWPADPADGDMVGTGWGIEEAAALCRWNVAGGFEYV